MLTDPCPSVSVFTNNLFMSSFKIEKMVSVSMTGEKQGCSGYEDTVAQFTNPPPSCISVILSTCLHLVGFICFLNHLYVEDYLLVVYILTGNSNSWVYIHSMRKTFDMGKTC